MKGVNMHIRVEDYLALSGIQHFAFCPRQWALIHLEQIWEDNLLTFKGQELHQKTNDPFIVEKRGDKITARAVPILSHSLKLYGVADVIEFYKSEQGVSLPGRTGRWRPVPVEYKVGRPKQERWDEIQLCAQAMCLEEMFGTSLDEGFIYYGRTRKRIKVKLDASLRDETVRTAETMHESFRAGTTPPANYTSKCESCSLVRSCVPKLSRKRKVHDYLKESLQSLDI